MFTSRPFRNGMAESLPIFSVASFWKHQQAVTTVHSFPGVGEALAEAGLPREWDTVQQRDAQGPLHSVVNATNP